VNEGKEEAKVEESPTPCPALVMEYYDKGTLYDFLHEDGELDWVRRWKLALEAAKGINHLHHCQPPIFHRDIKSLNFLMSHESHLRLADFGLSTLRSSEKGNAEESVGTVFWMAPELFKSEAKYTEKCDVYSYGMVLWEIMSREVPYSNSSIEMVKANVADGERLEIQDSCPPLFSELIKECWHQDPGKRPSMLQVVQKIDGILMELSADKK